MVERHLNSEEWTKQDRIRLAFAFHMRFTHLSQNKAFDRVLELSQRISDPFEMNYVTALILGLSGRRLNVEQQKRLKEVLQMTDLVKLIEQEATEKKAREIAEKLLRKGIAIPDVVESTGLSENEIKKLLNAIH